MMKGGKDEESNTMGPLFPRLHVNDANKGGPRAPPRNKMALYEQFSVPSQRLNSTSSASSRPVQKAGTSIASTSSNQGNGQDKPYFSSFNAPQPPAGFKVNSSDRVNVSNNQSTESGSHPHRKPLKLVRRELIRVKRTPPPSESSSRPTEEPSRRNQTHIEEPPRRTQTHIEEPSRRTVIHIEEPSRRNQTHIEEPPRRNQTHIEEPPRRTQTYIEEPSRRTVIHIEEPSRRTQTHIEEPPRRTQTYIEEPPRRTQTYIEEPSRRTEIHIEEPSRRTQTHNEEPSRRTQTHTEEPSRRQHRSGGGGEEDDFTVPTLLHQSVHTEKVSESVGKFGRNSLNLPHDISGNNREILRKGDGSGLNLNSEREIEDERENEEYEEDEERENVEENDMDLSPDDVVAVIGPKLFLKTRRAIVHQQRIFSVQVFELHRLIKVQKLMAGSPHILLEDYSYLEKSSQLTKPIPAITMPHETTDRDSPQKIKYKPDNSSRDPTPPAPNNQPSPSNIGSNMANNSMAIPVAPSPEPNKTNHNSPSWYPVQPPHNQWLVPVMSPLEGLVYKPYNGPCPPAGSFMAPFFPTLPSPTGDFMNSPYGVPVQVPVPPQNVGVVGLPNYFPPFHMPVMNQNPNPNISTSAVEQVSHLVLSNNNVPNPNTEQNNSHSSCNMSKLNAWRFRNSKESELQGSTASSPFEKGDGSHCAPPPPPLFPMGMAGMDALGDKMSPSGSSWNSTRVIRVVPHNARLATESAARIFQSIQKEKMQNE